MATKYLSNYYTYKVVPDAFLLTAPPVNPNAVLEKQVQGHLVKGHQYFFRGEFANARKEYQSAYAMLHQFLHPSFPADLAAINISVLKGMELTSLMLAATSQVAKYRFVASNQPVMLPTDSVQVTQAVQKLGMVGSTTPPSPALIMYQRAFSYVQAGATAEARPIIQNALRLNQGRDRQLESDLFAASGVVALQERKFAEARENFERAFHLAQEGQTHAPGVATAGADAAARASAPAQAAQTPQLAAISNNLGVVATLTGDAAGAGAAFQMAGNVVPLSLGRNLSQPLNLGTATALQRPMGGEGLGVILGEPVTNQFVSVPPSVAVTGGAQQFGVFNGVGTTTVDLTTNATANFTNAIYQPRINATTLEALGTYETIQSNFIAYLTHIYAFTIPMSLGDCYLELGEFDEAVSWYEKARDYTFLNKAIEAPMVWLKLGNAFLRWGHFLLEGGQKTDARAKYEKIVRLIPPILDSASALYKSPVFDGLTAQVQAILAAAQPLDPAVHNPSIAAVVLLAKLNMQNIENGIDFPLLSLSREQVPVFRFEYLQNVARYFAEHAIQAERTYINFKTSAEQEEFTRAMLENAVDLEAANEQLESKKVEIAQEQREAIEANQEYANTQLENAKDLKDEYEDVSLEEIALDSEITYVGAPTTEYDFSGYEEYGISDGTHRVDEVLRTLTRRRREISREFELNNLDRRISELEAAKAVADEQVDIAVKQEEAAVLQKNIATLRRQQAEQQLELFDSQEFTPDLWNRLANEIREISKAYLNQAIVIARLMEQSYEFEVGKPVNIIKPSYERNDLAGLLAGDFLLKDIDSFTFIRIVLGEKKQPMKEVISLADRYPVQFLRDFQRTGVMGFRTEIADFDRSYPGSYLQRIKKVEVLVEGLIGRGGIHASLTNTGLALSRVRDGRIKMRLLQPETLLISQYRVGPDSVVFTPDNEMLAIFEHSPLSTSWIFELNPAANDIVLNFITDVKLVIYYESFFDPSLKPKVLEELAVEQINAGRRTVALRYELFDEFFAFQDSGEVTFTLRSTMLPFYHTNPVIRELTVLLQTNDGVSPAGLVVDVRTEDNTSATQTTNADGAISTGGASALNAFVGKLWLQEWTIAMPVTANQARFDAGFEWSQVNNIVVITEYEFTPRRIPGEPYLLLLDRFETDTLAEFDQVDDPQATVGGPAAWSFNTTEERIEQTSNIHGGPVGPAATGPVKPGTYLVRKTTATQPALQNVIVAVNVTTTDDDGIGVVFRWQDVDNFYYFIMDSQRNHRRIGKKVGGVFQDLATAAVDLTKGYTVGTTYALRVRASGANLSAYLNDELILSGQDASLPDVGRVGLYCWGNQGASFDNLRIIEI
jgi:tetratricopeptide (TPR) repeat protein